MKFNQDYFALVIVGAWNMSIFTNEWVTKFIFDGQKVKVDPAPNPISSQMFGTDEIKISVQAGRLTFSVFNNTDAVFKQIEDFALKVTNYLEHTPTTAFGINFKFKSAGNEHLDELFLLQDEKNWAESGFVLSQKSIIRRFNDGNSTLNLTIIKTTEYDIELNYHFDIKSLLQFKELFTTNIILDFKNKSLSFLEATYDLKLEK